MADDKHEMKQPCSPKNVSIIHPYTNGLFIRFIFHLLLIFFSKTTVSAIFGKTVTANRRLWMQESCVPMVEFEPKTFKSKCHDFIRLIIAGVDTYPKCPHNTLGALHFRSKTEPRPLTDDYEAYSQCYP